MGACEVCDEAPPPSTAAPRAPSPPARWRAPSCTRRAAAGCSGKRDRAAFKDIREFTDADVINDYRFLEEALLEGPREAVEARVHAGHGGGAAIGTTARVR